MIRLSGVPSITLMECHLVQDPLKHNIVVRSIAKVSIVSVFLWFDCDIVHGHV